MATESNLAIAMAGALTTLDDQHDNWGTAESLARLAEIHGGEASGLVAQAAARAALRALRVQLFGASWKAGK